MISILYGEKSRFLSEMFCFPLPKNFVGKLFDVSEIFWHRKISRKKGKEKGVSRFSVKNLLSHSTEKLRQGTFLCFRKFQVRKKFMHKRGISRFSVEKLLSQSTEKPLRGALLCFRNFRVSKSFMHKMGVITICRPNNLFKNTAKGWDSNPYLPLQNLVVLPTVQWEPLEFLTNVSEIMKIIGTTETQARTYCLRTLLS